MSKAAPTAEELFEAPTEKRNIPDELLESPAPRVSVIVNLGRKVDGRIRESGVRRSISTSEDELERLARRDRETMPAPPDSVDERGSGGGAPLSSSRRREMVDAVIKI